MKQKSPRLIGGWVFYTAMQMSLLLADLVITLTFTTLAHLLLLLLEFILTLYTWAVVKSHMNNLKAEKKKPPLPEGAITDYTVDGIQAEEITVTTEK